MAVIAGDRLVWVDAVDVRRQELRAMALDGAKFYVLASAGYIKALAANGDEIAWLESTEQRTTELAWRHRDGTVERRRMDGAERLAFARGGLVVNLNTKIVWISGTGDATDTLEADGRSAIDGPYVRGDKIYWLAAPLADGADQNALEAWEEARKSSRATLWEAGPKTAAPRATGLVLSGISVAIDDQFAWLLVNGSLLRVSLSTGARETLHACEGSCTGLVDAGDALYFASSPPHGSWDRFERFDKATGSLTTAVVAHDVTATLLIVARGHLYWSDLARGIMRHALART